MIDLLGEELFPIPHSPRWLSVDICKPTTSARTKTPETSLSEPPSHAKVPTIGCPHDFAVIAHEVVVELQRDVRVRVIGQPNDVGRAIKLLQWQKACRHAVLSIKVLIAIERHQVMFEPGWK